MMAEDVRLFMDTAAWGEYVTVGASVGVPAIFDAPFSMGNVGANGMADSAPALTLATLDVPANPVGQHAVVRGVDYLIAAHEPDGTGVSKLYLELAT